MQACSQGSRSGRTTLSRAIILNIVVSLYAATGNSQFLNPKKGPKAEENDPPPLSEGWLRAGDVLRLELDLWQLLAVSLYRPRLAS